MSIILGSDIANIIARDARRREKRMEVIRKEQEEEEEEEEGLQIYDYMLEDGAIAGGPIVWSRWETANSLRNKRAASIAAKENKRGNQSSVCGERSTGGEGGR